MGEVASVVPLKLIVFHVLGVETTEMVDGGIGHSFAGIVAAASLDALVLGDRWRWVYGYVMVARLLGEAESATDREFRNIYPIGC